MEYVAATRNTDFRARLVQTRLIEVNLIHVQNRPQTVRVRAKAPERRTKFDPDEAMSQLNKIIKPCQTKSYRSAQMDECTLRKETSVCCPTLNVTR